MSKEKIIVFLSSLGVGTLIGVSIQNYRIKKQKKKLKDLHLEKSILYNDLEKLMSMSWKEFHDEWLENLKKDV